MEILCCGSFYDIMEMACPIILILEYSHFRILSSRVYYPQIWIILTRVLFSCGNILDSVYSHLSIIRIILNLGELGRGLVCALYTPRFHGTWDLGSAKKIPQSCYCSLYASHPWSAYLYLSSWILYALYPLLLDS